jgi:hypothetical protein
LSSHSSNSTDAEDSATGSFVEGALYGFSSSIGNKNDDVTTETKPELELLSFDLPPDNSVSP